MHKLMARQRAFMAPSIEKVRVGSKAALEASKKTLGQFLGSHLRRLFIELCNLLLGYDWLFLLVGLLNKKLGWISSVFLVYPANEDYTLAYTYRRRARKIKWKPWLVGIFWQEGKFGVKFAISACNRDFRDPDNKESLRAVVQRMEKLRNLFAAERKTFAGTLPGVLFSMRMIKETHEAEVTVDVVVRAIEQVRTFEYLPDDVPYIVLGGRGYIGRRVVAALQGLKGSGNVYCVDIANDARWPEQLRGKRAILVNIALSSALDGYIDRLWPGLVILNEVYPEPSEETERLIKTRGCECYHIVGVEGGAFPSFPHGYHGGIPCCAAWPSEEVEAMLFKVV